MESLRTNPTNSSPVTVKHINCFFGKRPNCCFLSTPKVANFGLFSLVFVKQNRAFCSVSRVSPKTQVDLGEEVNIQTEEIYESKMVHVKFQLAKECLFGQQFLIVGNDRVLGSWDPKTAVPLNWSDQHVWFAELDIPIGKLIEYKFILNDGTGEILWQPGPNRVFQAWETENTIVVSNDWENTKLQVITDLEQDDTQRNSLDMVNNCSELPKQLLVELSNEHFITEPITSSESTSSATSLKDNVTKVEEMLGNNGGVGTSNLVDYEEDLVLVPGLPSFLEAFTDLDKVDKQINLNDIVEVFAAEDDDSTSEIQRNKHQETLNKQEEKGMTDDKTRDDEEQKLKSKTQKRPKVVKLDKKPDSGPQDDDTDILVNDLQWGQKILRNFFTNLRLF